MTRTAVALCALLTLQACASAPLTPRQVEKLTRSFYLDRLWDTTDELNTAAAMAAEHRLIPWAQARPAMRCANHIRTELAWISNPKPAVLDRIDAEVADLQRTMPAPFYHFVQPAVAHITELVAKARLDLNPTP